MPRRSDLNGIPHNITQSFFGTQRYYDGGYMGDWLLNAARKLNLSTASLNVLQASFTPAALNIHPLVYHAGTLKEMIEKELVANGFDTDFITEAHIDFKFPNAHYYRTTIYCYPYLVDKDGRQYKAGRIIAEGLEPGFDPFERITLSSTKKASSLMDRIRKLFE